MTVQKMPLVDIKGGELEQVIKINLMDKFLIISFQRRYFQPFISQGERFTFSGV